MGFDIAKAKTRVIACGAILIAATALSGYFSVGLLSTVAAISGSISGGITANDLGDWAKRFRQNKKILDNQYLTQAVGLAISLVILNVADSEELLRLVESRGLPYPQGSLRRLADKTVEYWPIIARDKALDENYLPIQESQLAAMFAQDVQNFSKVKALDLQTWQQSLCWLANAAEVTLPHAVIHFIAEKLYNDFPQSLRNVLKHNAAKEGEAFAAMVLDLQGEALSTLKQVLSQNQEIIQELEKVAKRQDLYVAYHQMILGFREMTTQIHERINHLETKILQPMKFAQLWQKILSKAIPTDQVRLVLDGVLDLGSEFQYCVRLGSNIRFELNFDSSGYLLLLDKGTTGRVYCLCPSGYAPEPHLLAGTNFLPQITSPRKVFKVTGNPGLEQLLIVITQDEANIDWLAGSSNKVPLQLDADHLNRLLEYLNQSPDCKILYTEFTIIP